MPHRTGRYDDLRELRERYPVRSLVIFGSRARGDHEPDSDLDVAVEPDEGAPPDWKLVPRLETEIERRTGIKDVDVNLTPGMRPDVRGELKESGHYIFGGPLEDDL